MLHVAREHGEQARKLLFRTAFGLASTLGRPTGGIRPRRITYWLGHKAFDGTTRDDSLWRWHTDRFGIDLRLHPGYLMDRDIMAFGCYEPSLHRLIQRQVRPSAICVDAGANIGAVAMHMALRVGPKGQVHCFEPHPGVRQRLALHVNRNGFEERCRVHDLALSDRAGTVDLCVMQGDDENQGVSSIVGNGEHGQLHAVLPVKTITLDAFVEQARLSRVDFIKIDIQGAEPLLLRGGRQLLSRPDAPTLALELSPLDLRHLGSDSRELVELVESFGYGVYRLRNDGTLGRRLEGSSVAPDHYESTVVCCK